MTLGKETRLGELDYNAKAKGTRGYGIQRPLPYQFRFTSKTNMEALKVPKFPMGKVDKFNILPIYPFP